MTGAREGKIDGSKQQDSRAALFPRLHVAETKRAGPRGPPRNKMALFEQLTIPSHKFKPSLMPLPSSGRAMKSPAMTTPLYLPIPQVTAGSHDSMYSYVPMSYMNPTMMQTMACIPGYSYSGLFNSETTSSMNTSGSKGAVTERAAESASVGGVGPKTLSQANYKTPFKNGREVDEFAVPTYSSVTQSSEQTARPSSPIRVQKTPRGQRALPRVKGPVTQKLFPIAKEKCMEVTSSEHKDDGRWSTASGECVTASVIGNEVDLQEMDFSKLERIPSSESYPSTAPADKVCRADSLTTPSEQDMFSNVSSDNQSEEGSEPSQRRRDSSTETGSSMLDNAPAGSVQFQDVVHAFGQREFWKTQTIVIRQQRIFSRQVFELHRVLEVQQLLAKTLGLPPSIDEALEKEDDNVHMAESPIAEVPDLPQAESPVAEVPEIPLIAEAPEVPEIPKRCPEPKALSENSAPDLDPPHQPMDPYHIPMQQVFNPDAPSPPYAANPWAVRMASPFMYVPCPGSYPAGYGTYPMMGAPMPMYAPPGALQPVRFPTWQQQSGMPMLMNAQDSPVMAAWYGQQVSAGVQASGPARAPAGVQAGGPARAPASVQAGGSARAPAGVQAGGPARAPAGIQAGGPARAPAGIQAGGPARAPAGVQAGGPARAPAGVPIATARNDSPACHLERLASSGSDQATESTSDIADARQAGQDGERSGVEVNISKGSAGEACDWAKGWGRREGRWVRGDRSLVHKRANDVADLRGKEADCQNGDTARGGELTGRGGLQPANGSRPVDDPEVSREGPQEGTGSLKHMRSEGAFDPGVCRWFPILSPPKRPMHHNGVIKVVPRAVSAAPELAANILLSIQTDRQR